MPECLSVDVSKFLCYVLRHRPEKIGVRLDPSGYVDAAELVSAMRSRYPEFTMEVLQEIVATDDKKRYTLRDGQVRANQGHSVSGVLAVSSTPQKPPACLFHGTTSEKWAKIQASGGLRPMNRHHVHLSPDAETACRVGARRKGEIVILEVNAHAMAADGYTFLVSDNGVWLADAVPLSYLCVALIFASRPQ